MNSLMEMNFKKLCSEAIGLDLENPFEDNQMIGALMFLVNTILDIFFAVNTLSQYTIKPSHAHWIPAKRVLIYLHGTINIRLRYGTKNVIIHGYTDVHCLGNSADRKSTSRCCYSLGSAMNFCMSRKKKFISLSTFEVEYIATSMANCEVVWMRNIF